VWIVSQTSLITRKADWIRDPAEVLAELRKIARLLFTGSAGSHNDRDENREADTTRNDQISPASSSAGPESVCTCVPLAGSRGVAWSVTSVSSHLTVRHGRQTNIFFYLKGTFQREIWLTKWMLQCHVYRYGIVLCVTFSNKKSTVLEYSYCLTTKFDWMTYMAWSATQLQMRTMPTYGQRTVKNLHGFGFRIPVL
jgi:hypothetical protein